MPVIILWGNFVTYFDSLLSWFTLETVEDTFNVLLLEKLSWISVFFFQSWGSVYSELESSSGCWNHEHKPFSSCKYICIQLPLFTLHHMQRSAHISSVYMFTGHFVVHIISPMSSSFSSLLPLSQPSPSQQINLGPSSNPSAKPNDFHFLKVIGKGSFGKVLLARHRADDQFYAVKVLQKKAILKKKEVNAHADTHSTGNTHKSTNSLQQKVSRHRIL